MTKGKVPFGDKQKKQSVKKAVKVKGKVKGKVKASDRISKRGIVNEGRPTDYRPEYCTQIVEFFQNAKTTREITKKFITKSGYSEYLETVAAELPTIEEFAETLGTDTNRLEEWAKKNEAFKVAYARAKALQKNIILKNAITQRYSEGFSKFLLINNHGMKDKSETAVTGAEGGPIVFTDLERAARLKALIEIAKKRKDEAKK